MGTLAELATAGGTLVLAISTFASVRSANRAARAAELVTPGRTAAAAGPVPAPGSGSEGLLDRLQACRAGGRHGGGRGRGRHDLPGNVGAQPGERHRGDAGLAGAADRRAAPGDVGVPRQTRLYVAPSDTGSWQAALRDPDDPERGRVAEAVKARQPVTVEDVLQATTRVASG